MKKLNEVKQLRFAEGLFFYKPGDILLIHIDTSKTEIMLAKTRKAFNFHAIFLG
jgi:hypothetical protein